MKKGSPVYREETFFPTEHNTRPNSSISATASERMGAFGEMSYRDGTQRPPVAPHRNNQETPILTGPSPHSSNTSTSNPSAPLFRPLQRLQGPQGPSRSSPINNNGNYQPAGFRTNSRLNSHPRGEVRFNNNQNDGDITIETSDSQKKHLVDVYSMSGDTVEFAKNFSDYLNQYIPYQLSIAVLFFLMLIAFFMIVMGMLNVPYCPLEPMIPIWLIVAGVLFTISATFRIYFLIPTPRKSTYRRQQKRLGGNILCKGFELLFALANLVWLILGCVWVYGGHSYVRFEEAIYERHYCEPTVYWSAFIACTSFLIFFSLIIFMLLCLLAVGSWKDSSREDQELP